MELSKQQQELIRRINTVQREKETHEEIIKDKLLELEYLNDRLQKLNKK